MKGPEFESQPNVPEEELELVPEAGALETALILAQKLMSYGSPGMPEGEVMKKKLYLQDAETLLASADLTDGEVKNILNEAVRKAKEA